MSEDKEAFLDRWSRLKTDAREAPKDEPAAPPATAPEQKPPELPPVEQLTPESDFKPFMGAQVDGETRRAALKKLFADAHFNVPDPYEAYSEDYTGGDPIPAEMLKTLNHARKLLFDEPEKTSQAASSQAASSQPASQPASPPQDPKDVAGKQDT